MSDQKDKITYFAETDFRGQRSRFGIKAEDRSRHVYVIGKTGMGKSTVLETMAIQDILNGHGMAFLDPHGSAIDVLLEYVPEERVEDVINFAPFDSDYPISFNVMEDVEPDQRHLVSSGLMSIFKKIWVDAWSGRMEYILSNAILALLEYPNSTLLSVNRMLSDKGFREEVVKNVTDPSVKSFWEDDFAKWDERYMREAVAAIQNKIGQFISNPIIRNIIGQPKSSFDFRKVMDEKKLLFVNLSKGRVGEQNANLLGGMLVTKIYLAAMSRANVTKAELAKLPHFFLFVDEFQNFANESFADILSEARKYKLDLTMAHQYVAQMEDEVREAVFGNVGTLITFRVGPMDAELLEKVFAPTFTQEDIVNLGRFQIYLTLMIDGIGSKPFSAVTLNHPEKPERSFREEVIETSRRLYASPRSVVQKDIEDWHKEEFFTEKQSKMRDEKEGYLREKFGDSYISPKDREGLDLPNPSNQNGGQKERPRNDRENRRSRDNRNNDRPKNNKPRDFEPPKKDLTKRDATENNKNLLKDAIQKAMREKEEKEKSEELLNLKVENNPIPTLEEKKPESKPIQNSTKEVPEDILKQVLE